MKNHSMTITLIVVTAVLFLSICNSHADVSHWTHFVIAKPLPGEDYGTSGPVLADFDGDGDLDIAISRRSVETAYWYERVTDEKWIQHTMGSSKSLPDALGATALDVNRDGWIDVVMNQIWFKNPGNLRDKPDTSWPANPFPGGGHDIIAADINGDGVKDIISDIGEFWFDTANGLKQNRICEKHEFHGGTAPNGVGDLDGDGDLDIVLPGLWLENPGKGEGEWKRHEWPHVLIPNASYGTSERSWVADINADGQNDIVYTDCDTGWSHGYWIENLGKGEKWERHPLPDPPTAKGDVEGTGSFHSLGVADFDKDGDLDIFSGEQEDPDDYMTSSGKLAMRPKDLKERGFFWENRGTKNKPDFVPVVIHTDNPGWHDIQLGDVDGDGDIDIVSKVWNADTPIYHADFWRNEN